MRRRATWICRGLLVAWLTAVLAALHWPVPSSVGPEHEAAVRGVWRGAADLLSVAGAWMPDSSLPVGGDKVVHGLLFAPAGLLWSLARKLSHRRAGRVVLPALLGIAVLSELVQTLSGRIADPADVVANVAGAGAGWVLVRLLWREEEVGNG